MLALNDCAAAIEFYRAAFDAVEEGERYPYEGKIGHAELRIGDSKIKGSTTISEVVGGEICPDLESEGIVRKGLVMWEKMGAVRGSQLAHTQTHSTPSTQHHFV